MKKKIFVYSIRFVILVLLQVAIFNNINFGGYIDPLVYIWFLLMIPFETPKWFLLCIGFALGFSVDIFSGELGFHTAAATATAFFRPLVIALISSKTELYQASIPHVRTMGMRWYTTYTLVLVTAHSLIYFLIEIFRFSELHLTILRSLVSALITSIIILCLEHLVFRKAL